MALRMGDAMWWFWSVRGYRSEGRRWLEEALPIEGRGSPEVLTMALGGAGVLALDQGDLDRVQEACEEGIELLSHEARVAREAKLNLLVCLGWVAWQREEHGQAQQLFEESLALSREMRNIWWIATSPLGLATVSHTRGTLRACCVRLRVSRVLYAISYEKDISN